MALPTAVAVSPLLLGVAGMSLACSSASEVRAEPGEVYWETTFLDDFDGPANASPDADRWQMETGGWGWGNNELQTYTTRPQNVRQDGQGNLVITARRESFTGGDGIQRDYTSARIKTQDRFTQTFGRFEMRAKLPSGQGVWPAFWMLGEDIVKVGWPQCGEIDIMEHVGHEPGRVHGTIHGPGYSAGDSIGNSFTLPGGQVFEGTFHTFAVEWTPNRIQWFVDGQLFQTRSPASLGGRDWVFDHDHFLLLNLAIGGFWPGEPDATTVFPRQYIVDYVRASERFRETRPGIDNASFTDDDTAWQLGGNASVQNHNPSASPMRITRDGQGDSALKLFGTFAGGAETTASQAYLRVTPGKPHVASAFFRTNSDDAIAGTNNRVVLRVEWFDGYDQKLGEAEHVVMDGDSPVDQWQPGNVPFTPTEGANYATVSIVFDQPTSAGGAVWVDDVRYEQSRRANQERKSDSTRPRPRPAD